jgi:hypothetical protein
MEQPRQRQRIGEVSGANHKPPGLGVFLWRFFSGNHLDGKRRTDASWLRKGAVPPHHVTWWTSKPRALRAAWRWTLITIPSVWGIAYAYAPSWRINIVLLFTIATVPYLFHHGTMAITTRLPRPRVVSVMQHTIPADLVDSELDDVLLAEMDDDIGEIAEHGLDALSTRDLDDIVKAAKPRRTRRE